jgi:hypothetical protein
MPLSERDKENAMGVKGIVQVFHARFSFIC